MSEIERKEAIVDLQKQFTELNQEAYEKNTDLAQERGRQFENIVHLLFKAWGLLKRGSYHTSDNKSEQIDGVLLLDGRYALLEAKWVKANLAASELFSFLGKVEGKFTGTIGVFVSRNELTPNFLNALRAGRRQCIIVIHGRDVDGLFDPSFDLVGYLSAHMMRVCTDNLCHLSTEEYLTELKAAETTDKIATEPSDAVEAKIKNCLNEETAKNIANELAEQLSPTQMVDAVQRIVKDYADVACSPGGDEAWRGENLQEFLKELVERLPANRTEAEKTFFYDKFSVDFQSPRYRSMIKYFAPRYEYLSAKEKETCEKRLLRQWDRIIGEWMSENRMAEATRPLWDHLGVETKKHLISIFVKFVLSSRGTRHPQYQLADYVLRRDDSVPMAKEALLQHATKATKSWIEEEYTREDDLEKIEKSVLRAMWHLRQYIPDFEETIKVAVKETVEDVTVK